MDPLHQPLYYSKKDIIWTDLHETRRKSKAETHSISQLSGSIGWKLTVDFSASGDEDGVRALFGDLGEVEDCRGKTTGDAGEMLVGVGGLVGFLHVIQKLDDWDCPLGKGRRPSETPKKEQIKG